MNKEVSLIFAAPGWETCPFDTEIWTCNTIYRKIYRHAKGKVDKLFIMHRQVIQPNGAEVFNWEHITGMMFRHSFEVVALHDIPMETTPYPYDDIVDYFGTEYIASSHSYMLVYALYHGYTKVHIYGTHFYPGISTSADDLYERCGLEYWIGRANGMGVEVEVHGGDLLITSTGEPYAIHG